MRRKKPFNPQIAEQLQGLKRKIDEQEKRRKEKEIEILKNSLRNLLSSEVFEMPKAVTVDNPLDNVNKMTITPKPESKGAYIIMFYETKSGKTRPGKTRHITLSLWENGNIIIPSDNNNIGGDYMPEYLKQELDKPETLCKLYQMIFDALTSPESPFYKDARDALRQKLEQIEETAKRQEESDETKVVKTNDKTAEKIAS